ncbi:carboxymuconolactone decarboxylase family protein [Rummeliibacillus sp. NPDC094406]|uniref:carboxymuconolactone decarboxylase family protein n=1 Tax=Rummeliibacillus sp. NPDC094406 TaxID=3364511 RepID=UPI0038279F77
MLKPFNYAHFINSALKEGTLSAKLKEIIAVATAHAAICPYFDVHIKNEAKIQMKN